MRTAMMCVAFILLVTEAADAASRAFAQDFVVDRGELVTSGRNPYFILEPGYQQLLASKDGALSLEVLKETRMLDNVEVRVVEERETRQGRLVKVARQFFAISSRTGCVFNFGEDVDVYGDDGRVADHKGSWYAGENGAKAGLMMPGRPMAGDRYCQEIAPKIAMGRTEVIRVDERKALGSVEYAQLLETEVTTPLEPRNREHKWYAPGIGLVKDGAFELAQYGFTGKLAKAG